MEESSSSCLHGPSSSSSSSSHFFTYFLSFSHLRPLPPRSYLILVLQLFLYLSRFSSLFILPPLYQHPNRPDLSHITVTVFFFSSSLFLSFPLSSSSSSSSSDQLLLILHSSLCSYVSSFLSPFALFHCSISIPPLHRRPNLSPLPQPLLTLFILLSLNSPLFLPPRPSLSIISSCATHVLVHLASESLILIYDPTLFPSRSLR